MLSRTAQAYSQIQKCLTPLLEGTIVSIDPSIGSTSSQPGWAVYRAGQFLCRGTLSIAPDQSVPARLRKLYHLVRQLYKDWDPDVLVYEEIPPLRQGGGNAAAHASLLKAVGVILSVSGPDHYVGLLPVSWKRMARSTYVKGDAEDAEEIAWIAIEEAKRIQEIDPPYRRYGERRSSKSSQGNDQEEDPPNRKYGQRRTKKSNKA